MPAGPEAAAGKAARGFAVVGGGSLIGWQHADRENGPVLIQAEHGEMAAQMLEQIRMAQAA